MSGTDERVRSKGEKLFWGLRPQAPGIYRFDANPSEMNLVCWGSAFTEPQPGLGPGVDAQAASQQSPILRSGRLQCIRDHRFYATMKKKQLAIRSAFRHARYQAAIAPCRRGERPSRRDTDQIRVPG